MGVKGYVQLYTGNGKGKTTAAFGLAVRALCAGKRVYIAQFVKNMKYNETKLGSVFPELLLVEQLGNGCFLTKEPTEEDVKMARLGLERCKKILLSNRFDVVILDELTIAIYFNLLSSSDVIDVLKNRSPSIEVVITGRYASQDLIDYSDLVTEMLEVKHYYYKGVLSRDGIDK